MGKVDLFLVKVRRRGGKKVEVASIISQAFAVRLEIPLHLVYRIAAEFFAEGIGEDYCEHCFADDAGGGDGGDVGAFEGGEVVGFGVDIDGM